MRKTLEIVVNKVKPVINETYERYFCKLPDTIPNHIQTTRDIIDTYQSALEMFSEYCDVTNVCTALNLYLRLSAEELIQNQQLKRELKTARKSCLILKSTFDFFNIQGSPKKFSIFVKQLGMLGDMYYSNSGKKYAKKSLEALHALSDIELVFNPTSITEYGLKKAQLIADIKKSLQKQEISIHEYHELRKNIRHFRNLYATGIILHPDDRKLRHVYSFLYSLSKDLGEIHDAYAKLKVKNKAEYMSLSIRIHPRLTKRMKMFVDKF